MRDQVSYQFRTTDDSAIGRQDDDRYALHLSDRWALGGLLSYWLTCKDASARGSAPPAPGLFPLLSRVLAHTMAPLAVFAS